MVIYRASHTAFCKKVLYHYNTQFFRHLKPSVATGYAVILSLLNSYSNAIICITFCFSKTFCALTHFLGIFSILSMCSVSWGTAVSTKFGLSNAL